MLYASMKRQKTLLMLILSIHIIAGCGSPSSSFMEEPAALTPPSSLEATVTAPFTLTPFETLVITTTTQFTMEPELLTPSETSVVPTITPVPSHLTINENTATSVELLASYESHSGRVTDIALLPGGQQVLSVSSDGENRIWDLLSLQDIHVSNASFETQAWVAVIDDDLVVVAREKEGKVVIQNIISGTIVLEFAGRGFGFDGVVFSPDGKRVATSQGYKRIIVWDILSTKLIQRIAGDWYDTNDYPIFGAFSPDGNILVVTFTNEEMIAYDVNSGEQLHSFSEKAGMEFLRDGEILAVTWENLIRMYDTRSWEVVSELDIGEFGVGGISYAHHSNLVAIPAFGGGIQIWDTQNGTILTTLHDTSGFLDMRFSSDDRYLFTYRGQSGNINVWGLP